MAREHPVPAAMKEIDFPWLAGGAGIRPTILLSKTELIGRFGHSLGTVDP